MTLKFEVPLALSSQYRRISTTGGPWRFAFATISLQSVNPIRLDPDLADEIADSP